jgi:hypothetical protein
VRCGHQIISHGSTEREMRNAIEDGIEGFETPGGIEALVRSGLASADEHEVRAWAHMIRYGGSPGASEALDRMNMAIDVRAVLGLVSAPSRALAPLRLSRPSIPPPC